MRKTIADIIDEEIQTFNKKVNFKEGVGDKYLSNKHSVAPEFQDFDKKFKAKQSDDNIIYRDGDWVIYKNPKNLENIGESARGVIDKDGNLFIENFSQAIHHDIIKILIARGYLKGYEFKKNWNSFLPSEIGFLTVQRYGNTNNIAIGHSNKLIYDDYGFKQHYQDFNDFINKARTKSPDIGFETKLVSSKFGELKKVSNVIKSNEVNEHKKLDHYMSN